ncbi:immunity protein YezG family protein [Vibrio cidicii]|uniref:immunity protein YezG family protein n=1 Tax=Vibrio cidicii TaxID=1763883 RepID=UPI003750F434
MLNGNVEDIYFGIAKKIVEKIDDDWVQAELKAEIYGNAAKFRGTYNSSLAQEQQKFFKVHHELFDLFEELHKITTENPNNKWNRAIFTLEPSGNFNIDFEWDQALADEIERLNKE